MSPDGCVPKPRRIISVSQIFYPRLSEILKERMSDGVNYEAAKARALARKPFLKSDGPYLTREETHDGSR
jgi:hypothetical protein